MTIRVLFLAANPSDTLRLRQGDEVKEITRRIQGSPRRDCFRLEQALATTAEELTQTLLQHQPTILHFSGHGSDQGELMLVGTAGRSVLIPPEALANMFALLAKDGLRCVVLNACYSARLAPAIIKSIDYVVGISGQIPEKAAHAFTAGFYTGLGAGKSLPEAFDFGCVQIELLRLPGSNLPQQHIREGVELATLHLAGENSPMAIPPTKDLVEQLLQYLSQRSRILEDEAKLSMLTAEIDRLVRQITERRRVKADDLVAGTKLFKPLGRGNFGTVWLAKCEGSGKPAATKVFHMDNLATVPMLWQFRRGIRAMKHLNADRDCPNSINRIISVSEDMLAFSMDYCSGGNIEDIARRGWSTPKKLEIFAEICRAVEFAHSRGVIHRDIKPGNIVLDEQHRPVLTDFDIANIKFVTKLSIAQGGLGTPVFAAPEQLVEGDHANEQSDIYSLGRLLYFLLLEKSPGYQIELDPSLEDLSSHGYQDSLVAIVRQATQFKPSRRYSSVTTMLEDLQRFNRGWAAFKAKFHLAQRWVRHNFAILGVFVLVISGTSAFGIYNSIVADRESKYSAELEASSAKLKEYSDKLEKALAASAALETAMGELRSSRIELEKQRSVLEEKLQKERAGSAERLRLAEELERKKLELQENQQKTKTLEYQKLDLENKLSEAKKSAQKNRPRPNTKKPTTKVSDDDIL